jgi:hypothetical protein
LVTALGGTDVSGSSVTAGITVKSSAGLIVLKAKRDHVAQREAALNEPCARPSTLRPHAAWRVVLRRALDARTRFAAGPSAYTAPP